ncbi:MAG: hypothetical protein JW772_05485 [Candidatus Diapherotrites archaeon]|nr:hypothetical protein [Candidatus Diapherotrites archaeon]
MKTFLLAALQKSDFMSRKTRSPKRKRRTNEARKLAKEKRRQAMLPREPPVDPSFKKKVEAAIKQEIEKAARPGYEWMRPTTIKHAYWTVALSELGLPDRNLRSGKLDPKNRRWLNWRMRHFYRSLNLKK